MKKSTDFAAALDAASSPAAWEQDSFEPQADGRPHGKPSGILVRLDRRVRDDLKRLAIDEGTTVQGLMVEGINLILARRNRLPVA